MSRQLEVIYQGGAFRPLEPLSLEENQRLTIILSEDAETATDDPEEDQIEEMAAIWRGVFAIPFPYEEIPLSDVELPQELPEWQPEISIDSRWFEEEDDT